MGKVWLCLMGVFGLLAGADNWPAGARYLIGAAVATTFVGSYLWLQHARDAEHQRKIETAYADPKNKHLDLENEWMRLWRSMSAAERSELRRMRVPLISTPGPKGPDERFDLDGAIVPRQFVLFYFQCASPTHLPPSTGPGGWSDGELWDDGDPDSDQMRHLAEVTKRYLQMRNLAGPAAGPQRAEVYSWETIYEHFGFTLAEVRGKEAGPMT
jgi:hypothetical protein